MRILLVGATGFIGSHVLRWLLNEGHSTAIFHRGQTKPDLPRNVTRIIGDRQHLDDYISEFDRFAPHVVVDMIPYGEQAARALIAIFHGRTERIVAISSQDVYRAYGLFLRLEDGEVE